MSRKPRMTLHMLAVIKAFTDQPDRAWFGMDLMRHTGLASGTVYPILARCESAGWLIPEWETGNEPGRPARCFYRINPAARDEIRAAWKKAVGLLRDERDATVQQLRQRRAS